MTPPPIAAILMLLNMNARDAYERLHQHFAQRPGDRNLETAKLILLAFSEDSIGRVLSEAHGLPRELVEPRGAQWFVQEPRWVDLFVKWQRDKRLGAMARQALRAARPEHIAAALHREQDQPRLPVKPRLGARGDLVARYARGEREAVWAELRGDPAIGGPCREEAMQVARATLRVVARNADLLVSRLECREWTGRSGQLRTRSPAEDEEAMRAIERATGAPLPVSLRAFWEIVGGIDCVRDPDDHGPLEFEPALEGDLTLDCMNPLCIWSPAAVLDELSEWEEQNRGVHPDIVDAFRVDLATDEDDPCGGEPYGIALPCWGADPPFGNDARQLPFVEYLRSSLSWGGFPGLARFADSPEVQAFVRTMTAGMEPF